MLKRFHSIMAITVVLPIVYLGDAFASKGTPTPPQESVRIGVAKSGDEKVNREIAAVRRATEHFHRLDNALDAGYIQLSPCIELPSVGGMGYHYGNMDFLLDQEANILEPDVLVYEPQPNGALRLVAVEYIVPVFPGEPIGLPPMLFGHDMHWDEELHAWTLHAWVWQANPDGIFEHWNPNVDCDFDFVS